MIGIERVGHIVLQVADFEASMAFYRDVLGMEVTSYRPGKAAFLSFGTQHHDIAVFQDDGSGSRGELGLSHLALRLPGDDHDLRTAYDQLKAKGVEIHGTTDHDMTHSVYFHDPDGNRLEIYVDVYAPEEGMEVMRKRTDYRERLDIEAISAR